MTLDRRQWLRLTASGSIGAGAGLPRLEGRAPEGRGPQMITTLTT